MTSEVAIAGHVRTRRGGEERAAVGGMMEQCESKVGGICARPATWKQTVHAGHRAAGRFLLHSYWCDEHADNIVQKRLREWLPPPQMVRLVPETP